MRVPAFWPRKSLSSSTNTVASVITEVAGAGWCGEWEGQSLLGEHDVDCAAPDMRPWGCRWASSAFSVQPAFSRASDRTGIRSKACSL